MPKRLTKTVYTFAELKAKQAKGKATAEAVERAAQWLREGQTDHDWYDYTYEMWKSALAQVGFDNADISFSGFWSQGDGASFTASVDLDVLINFLAAPPAANECIDSDGNGGEDFRPWLVHKCNGVQSNPKFAKLLKIVHADLIDGARVYRGDSHYCHEHTCSFEAEDLRDRGEYHPRTSATKYNGYWESETPRVRKLYDEFVEAAEELRLDISRAIYKSLEEEHEYLTGDEAIADFAEANEYTFTINGKREG